MSKLETLAEFLEVGTDEITESEYYDNGFSYGNQEYLVLTDEEADEKAREEIRETLWAFDANFIMAHAKNYNEMSDYEYRSAVDSLSRAQRSACENLNGLVFAIIEDFDDFVESAVMTDGRGHFIAGYDGYENELNGYYIYRVD